MRTIFLLSGFLLAITSMSCKDTKKSDTDALFDQVMAEHDEAMTLMNDIFQQTKHIKALRSSENAQKLSDELDTIDHQLKEAEEAMMQWMANFRKPDKETNTQEAQKYLNTQYQSIKMIHQKMKKAISNAKNFETE